MTETGINEGQDKRASDAELAVGLALGSSMHDERLIPHAIDLLDVQTQLARLQYTHLARQTDLEISHLRWQKFNDRMQGAMKVAITVVILFLLVFAGREIWSASHDNNLVVEPFRVPSDLAGQGLSGEALASLVVNRLTRLQRETDSLTAARSYRSPSDEQLNIQIPQTGVSLGELDRFLRRWLGSGVRIDGVVWHKQGQLEIITQVGENPPISVVATEATLDTQLDRVAEGIFGVTQPYRYSLYLIQNKRDDDALAFLSKFVGYASVEERAWSLIAMGRIFWQRGNLTKALDAFTQASQIAPRNANAPSNLATIELLRGHEEAMLADRREATARLELNSQGEVDPGFVTDLHARNAGLASALVGDYGKALSTYRSALGVRDSHSVFLPAFVAASEALDHAPFRARRTLKALGATNPRSFDYQVAIFSQIASIDADLELHDWAAAEGDLGRATLLGRRNPGAATYFPANFEPYRAYLMAVKGDLTGAELAIGRTLLDCDLCVRIRGRLAAIGHDWGAVDRWYGLVSVRSPSIPLSLTEWGEALRERGDLDGAILKFRDANRISPHYADPLEAWGEALMLENRSDLALAKFADAGKYAPDWARLHMKWGEALGYAGRKDESRAQYRIASTLDLSVADKVELARDIRG